MTIVPVVTKLKNSFSIVTEEMRDVDSVCINIWVKVGSRHEAQEQIGLAHFLEHMAFKGTSTKSALDIAKAFDAIGGNFNAYTGKEYTVYHVKVVKRDVALAMEILSDIILHSEFPEIEIEREKNVVLQEIYQTNDTPSSIIFDKYMEVAYKDQVFGQSVLGSEASVKNLSKADLETHMRNHYYGSNMLLSVAGSISHDEVLKLSEGFTQVQDRVRPPMPTPTYTGGRYAEERNLEQVNLIIGFPGVSYKDDRYYTMQVLDSVMGSSMSSRLFQEVREKLGLVYSISSFNSHYSDGGLFSIHAATDEGNLHKLLTVITTEIKKLFHDIKEEEIDRAKRKLESEILMSKESPGAKAESLGYYYSHYGRNVTKKELIQKIHEVTLKDVANSIGLLLQHRDKITLAAIGAISSLPQLDEVASMLA